MAFEQNFKIITLTQSLYLIEILSQMQGFFFQIMNDLVLSVNFHLFISALSLND